MNSPYANFSDSLRDRGYHVMPCMPGAKVPGSWDATTGWRPMAQWQSWCAAMPPTFTHERWSDWPDAGICMAHGEVVGLDVDTDRKDVSDAAMAALGASPARRVGSKGWMGYYRAGRGADGHGARVRWYDGETICLELLLHGSQSVLPPTIHPGTKQPYKWVTPDTLEDLDPADLPELPADAVARLDAALGAIGLTRKAPRKVGSGDYERPQPTAADLEKPFGRSLNDRAMEPEAIDRWWPALGMPKSRHRGRPGAWEAVPFWRGSNSGRGLQDRNPNLKATLTGIVDFGADRTYTPVDVVMAARDCSFVQAAEWLAQYIRPEEGMSAEDMLALVVAEKREAEAKAALPPPAPERQEPRAPMALQRMLSKGRGDRSKPREAPPTTRAEYDDAFPAEALPFPVQDYERDLTGLLRELTLYLDEAANMRSEQGAFGAALAMLGTIMGRKVEVAETGLRTNLYVVATANSGAGKSSAMTAMLGAFDRCGVADRLAGSDFTSGSAILREMDGPAPRLFSIDEFGDVVRRILNPRAPGHEQDIRRILKDIYSAASGTYRGKSYATQDRQDLIEPHLCIYGASTHEAFWEGIDGRSFSDGLLARLLMVPIGATEVQTPSHERAAMVADMVSNVVLAAQPKGNLAGASDLAQAVEFGPGVWSQWLGDRALFQRHARRAEIEKIHGAPSIIGRICENGMKVAMISAMGRDPIRPTISPDDYTLGLAVSHWSAIYMINAIATYYVENSSHRDLNRVLDFITATGAAGCAKTRLLRGLRGVFAQGGPGKTVLDALKESGDVIEWQAPAVASGGRPSVWYVARDYAEAFFAEKGAE